MRNWGRGPPRVFPGEPRHFKRRFSKATILLVDDDASVRTALGELLKMRGYEVIPAINGGEALQFFVKHDEPIDILITDIVMPLMNGRELAREIKKLRPDVGVPYLSGSTDELGITNDLLEPRSAFLSKPVSSEVLLQKVKDLLE